MSPFRCTPTEGGLYSLLFEMRSAFEVNREVITACNVSYENMNWSPGQFQ